MVNSSGTWLMTKTVLREMVSCTLTADKIGEHEVEHGHVHLDDCTDTDNKENCDRQAGGKIIINPVRSARLNTRDSFTFKYGRVEMIAKNPLGDWLWPGKVLLHSSVETLACLFQFD